MIFFIIAVWAGSSLFIAPIVQWGVDSVSAALETRATHHEARLLDVKLSIPCDSFETLPVGCDGFESDGEVVYGPVSVLYFWGRLPTLEGLTFRERALNEIPNAGTAGAFYTLQKSFGRLPVGDDAVTLARTEMAAYGAFSERQLSPGVQLFEAAEGSATRLGNFYAVYTRDDGLKVAAACFGDTCKLAQGPWRDGLAYGLTINKDNAARLPEIDAAVRRRLDGYVAG